jgi:hypothetical protein
VHDDRVRDGSFLLTVLDVVVLGLLAWGIVDAALRKPEVFPAANRLTKPIWLGILAAGGVLVYLAGAFSLLGSAAMVAAIVYLGDVRPAVRGLRSGGW